MNLKGVNFDDFHSWNDFSLILSPNWEIEAPSPKIEEVDIPGGDGVLDFSEAFGEVKYNNRKLILPFSTIVPRSEFWDLFSTIQNSIHGKKMKIILDNDPDWYYFGRITVDKWKADKNVGTITVECNCEPYKYKIYKTKRADSIDGTKTLTYLNSRKTVVPTIAASSPMTITFNETTYALDSGFTISSQITFAEGYNDIVVTGNGVLWVEYQEGSL